MIKLVGLRKLGLAVVITTLITIFVFIGKASVDQWNYCMMIVYGTYSGANVGEYFGKRAGISVTKNLD